MSRKLKLNAQQNDLLATLEETGAGNLPTIVVSLKPNDIQTFENNVHSLLELELVEFYRDLCRQDLHFLALSQSEINDLPAFQKILDHYNPKQMCGIMLTESGRASLRT